MFAAFMPPLRKTREFCFKFGLSWLKPQPISAGEIVGLKFYEQPGLLLVAWSDTAYFCSAERGHQT